MYDGNGYPLDVAVVGITATTPTIIQTGTPHRLSTGKTVFLFNTNSLPNIDGAYVVTVITSTTFSIPTTVLTAGNQGTATVIPKELKWATSEFAGQLIGEDRTLDSDIARQKLTALRAGSVALSFGDGVTAQVIPDAVTTLLVPSWLTTEVVEGAVSAEWTVV
jgi:hypothetical protein